MTVVINGTTGVTNVNGSASTPAVTGTTTNTGIYFPSASTFGIATAGVNAVYVDASQNVGVGTNSPSTYGGLVVQAASGVGAPLTLLTTDAGANTQAVFKGSRQYQIGTGNASSGFAGSLFFYDGTAAATRMLIDSSGNVGIGTSSPGVKLDVAPANLGNTAGNTTWAFRAGMNDGNVDVLDMYWSRTSSASGWSNADLIIRRNVDNTGNQGYINFGGANTVQFGTNGAERMRIDSSGRLGFQGSTSNYGAVTFYGTKNGWGGINFNSSAGTNIGTVMVSAGYGGFYQSADNAWIVYFTDSGGMYMSSGVNMPVPPGSAPMYTARAWVNFNGSTLGIRASGNVSSIARVSTGYYTVSFSTAMSDANYSALCVVGTSGAFSGQNPEPFGKVSNFNTGSVAALSRTGIGGTVETDTMCVAVFR